MKHTKNTRVISYSKFQTTFSQSEWWAMKRKKKRSIKMRNTTEQPNERDQNPITIFRLHVFPDEKKKKNDKIFNIQMQTILFTSHPVQICIGHSPHPAFDIDAWFHYCRHRRQLQIEIPLKFVIKLRTLFFINRFLIMCLAQLGNMEHVTRTQNVFTFLIYEFSTIDQWNWHYQMSNKAFSFIWCHLIWIVRNWISWTLNQLNSLILIFKMLNVQCVQLVFFHRFG